MDSILKRVLPLLFVAGSALAQTPTLYQGNYWGALDNNRGLSDTSFTVRKVEGSGSGNCIVLFVDYSSGHTITSITDDMNNTWPTTPVDTADAGARSMKTEIFVLPNAASGTREITVNLSDAETNIHLAATEFYNCATSSPTGVHASSITGTAPNVSTPAISPTSGNLVLHYAFQNPNIIGGAGSTSVTSWTAQSGWALESADFGNGNTDGPQDMNPYALQVRTAPGGPITPTLTTSGTNTYNTIAFELKGAAGGTAPPAGIWVSRVRYFTNTNINASPWTVPFPNSGNLIAGTEIAGIMQATSTSSPSLTWRLPVVGTVNGNVALFYARNTSPSTAMTISLSVGAFAKNPNTTIAIYDIQRAHSTAPFDHACTSTPTIVTGDFQHQPDCTPNRRGGIMITACAIGEGPLTSLTAPTGANFNSVSYPGETDFDSFNNADGYGAYRYGTSLDAQNWSWGFAGTNTTAYSTAGEFRGPAVTD